jgi:rod shape-determining protein MreC
VKLPLVDTWPGRVALFFLVAGIAVQSLPTRLRRAVVAPAQDVLLWPLRAVAGQVELFASTAAENRRLAELAARLAVQNARLQTLLRGFEETGDFDPALVRAPIVARDLSTFEQYLLLSRGARSGVREAAPVVSPDGIVGKVVRAGADQSLVQTLHAPQFRVSVLDVRSRTPALAGPLGRGSLQLYFVAKEADFRTGDTLVTAGLGGVFPRGLAVGTVEEVGPGEDVMFRRVTVRPFASVVRLQSAFVLVLPEERPDDDWLDNIGQPDTLVPEGEPQ